MHPDALSTVDHFRSRRQLDVTVCPPEDESNTPLTSQNFNPNVHQNILNCNYDQGAGQCQYITRVGMPTVLQGPGLCPPVIQAPVSNPAQETSTTSPSTTATTVTISPDSSVAVGTPTTTNQEARPSITSSVDTGTTASPEARPSTASSVTTTSPSIIPHESPTTTSPSIIQSKIPDLARGSPSADQSSGATAPLSLTTSSSNESSAVSSRTTSAGSIAGGILGAISICLLGVAIFIFVRRRRMSAGRRQMLDAEMRGGTITPFISTARDKGSSIISTSSSGDSPLHVSLQQVHKRLETMQDDIRDGSLGVQQSLQMAVQQNEALHTRTVRTLESGIMMRTMDGAPPGYAD
ncbi:hypothetical protein FB45DRAFT_923043 [Roridomyces roridus]|uniref:Uncharacterized protein n=1 Tax=Roridomyces roridus TaxID=1738132 RepID=A0AAD7BNX5_9AGAR|nr:hypothetical protein FB45DRAFT_923043 [Roridomyces roridus]